MDSRDLGCLRAATLTSPGCPRSAGGSRPPDFVLLVLAYGLQGERIVGYFKQETDVRVLRGKTRGPIQVGGYASREDPVLVDIVKRFEAGSALPIKRKT